MMKINCPKCGEEFDLDEMQTAAIISQVRTKEFESEVNSRVASVKSLCEAEARNAVTEAVDKEREKMSAEINKLNTQINSLNIKIELADSAKDLAVEKAKAEVQAQYTEQIAQLNADNRMLEKAVELYKDMKAKLTTKAVGESLELFCENEFNKIRASAFPNAYFDKDNAVSRQSASKGDYIFRDYDDDGMEYISIMFEMKNETDSTASAKKRNDYFFDELDKDRKEKKCEYAVLVSLLERDSEFYEQGIADVSYAHPKMYVIRPQYFVTLISLLRNVAKSTAEFKKQVLDYQSRHVELSRFEKDLDIARNDIVADCSGSRAELESSIEEIDKAMKRLDETKTHLTRALKKLKKTEEKTKALTLDSLTQDNAGVLKMFHSEQEGDSEL